MINSEIKDEYINTVCERCKYSNIPDAFGTKCYLCKRNAIDHRIDYYEPDYSKICKSETTGVQIMNVVSGCPCTICTDYERRCCTIRCDEYDKWLRKLMK